MRYLMKAGVLYDEKTRTVLARLKGSPGSPQKDVFSPDGTRLLRTDILSAAPAAQASDVPFRKYSAVDITGAELLLAKPDYAPEEDPECISWPVCRAPLVNRAFLSMPGGNFCLIMRNNQNYCLESKKGAAVLQIVHRGLTGGWDIEAKDRFSPEIICAIFAFCKYIEQENEFILV